MRRFVETLIVAALSVALFAVGNPAQAQFGGLKDRLKKKVEEKVGKKIDGADSKKEAPKAAKEEPQGDEEKAPAAKVGGTATSEDMTLYTKYDFIPGDKVIFYDDLSGEEIGEFPSRWGLDHGVFEIAKLRGQKWILCTNKGVILPKLPPGPLPDKYTVELEFNVNAEKDGWYYINWLDAEGEVIGKLSLGYDHMTSLWMMDRTLANKEIQQLAPGRHVFRIMATRTTMKCYIDQERIANVPKIDGFAPVKLSAELNPYFDDHSPMGFGTLRYAEGGKTMKEQLDEAGRIVTHGILFDSGSDKIKAESYKTLAEIGSLLTDNPALRISVEGHTDSDGIDAANTALSQKRAESVKTCLVDSYKIAADRLETKGWGESKPIDKNDSPEGKANNRRVELVKL
jgi:OmpA-OmpF porin, OOP family